MKCVTITVTKIISYFFLKKEASLFNALQGLFSTQLNTGVKERKSTQMILKTVGLSGPQMVNCCILYLKYNRQMTICYVFQ